MWVGLALAGAISVSRWVLGSRGLGMVSRLIPGPVDPRVLDLAMGVRVMYLVGVELWFAIGNSRSVVSWNGRQRMGPEDLRGHRVPIHVNANRCGSPGFLSEEAGLVVGPLRGAACAVWARDFSWC
jgi:hypothetical protein